MENVFFTAEPLTILVITTITVVLIALGARFEKPQLPIIIVVYGIGFLVYHTVLLNNTTDPELPPYYFSIAFDLIILFLGFITYLWVDDMAAKNKKLKSYSESLSWFWDKL